MTDRERRQRRLLEVRTIQADLAASDLRRLRAEQKATSAVLQQLRECAGASLSHLSSGAATHNGWLLACAEGELAAIFAERLRNEMEQREQKILLQTTLEQQARQQQEQMNKMCERSANETRMLEERQTQSRLDDLFSAGRVRSQRLAVLSVAASMSALGLH